LEELYNTRDSLFRNKIVDTLIDMAINNVNRKCTNCYDTGTFLTSLSRYSKAEQICDCNRVAYLEQCESKLGKNGQS
jgi:hypothetical protein